MKNLKIYDDSKNYTCQVINLPKKIPVKGLDNLVEVNVQGNSCLVGKDSPENELYLFFPAECQISEEFLSANNLYRHTNLNTDQSLKGFFEDNGRVKALKFKGIISSGFVIPLQDSLKEKLTKIRAADIDSLQVGDEFNEIDGVKICQKYYKKVIKNGGGFQNPRVKTIDSIVDSKQVPEHMNTAHLMKSIHKLALDTIMYISYKLHGTSARTYRTLVKKKLSWKDKIAKWLGVPIIEEQYDYVTCSRRQVKAVGFEELPNKNHFYTDGDLWSEFAKKNLDGKLNKGEAVYYEIIGKTYTGQEIQGGYSYGLTEPKAYVYRITNINPDGIEIDLPYDQMKIRAEQLGLEICPEFFKGSLQDFIIKYSPQVVTEDKLEEFISDVFYNKLLEKPSVLDSTVVEEGFCVRTDRYTKPEIFKIKSKKFLEYETKAIDKELTNLEDEQTQENETNE